MKISALSTTLELFKKACDAKSVVPAYKMITITPDKISCRSGWAGMDCNVKLGVDTSFAIECEGFAAVVGSLPSDSEIVFNTDGTTLTWKCAGARGRLATVPADTVEPLPATNGQAVLPCDNEISKGFDFGSISSTSSMAGFGGMMINWKERGLWFLSSDDVTIAGYNIQNAPKTNQPVSGALATGACDLLSALAKFTGGKLTFGEKGVTYSDRQEWITAYFMWAAPLKVNLLEAIINYIDGEIDVPLPKDRVKAFVSRSQALAAVRQRVLVSLHITAGDLSLEFAEQTSQHEEFNLIEKLEGVPDITVHLEATKLSKALAECDSAILDNLDRNALVFTSKDKKAFYLVSVMQNKEQVQ